MRRFSVLAAAGVVALLTSAVMAAQATPAAPKPATPGTAAKPAAAPAGPTYRIVGTIKEIMEGIVDPASDVLFESVATDITAEGVNDKKPQNDDEWKMVENNALMLAEAANLLKMPGRQVARPGEDTRSEGPDAPELTAPEIQRKINGNRALFYKYATALQTEALKALDAAKKKDADALFAVGEDIDVACENCHLEYWYPNDKQARALHEQALADREKARAAEAAAKAAEQKKK